MTLTKEQWERWTPAERLAFIKALTEFDVTRDYSRLRELMMQDLDRK